jgi:hypothetical protein
MSTWWKVDKYLVEIAPVEVFSSTKNFITLAPQGYSQAQGDEYFPTFAEARTWLMETLNNRYKQSQQELESLRAKWTKAFMMEAPEAKK